MISFDIVKPAAAFSFAQLDGNITSNHHQRAHSFANYTSSIYRLSACPPTIRHLLRLTITALISSLPMFCPAQRSAISGTASATSATKSTAVSYGSAEVPELPPDALRSITQHLEAVLGD